MNKGNKMKKNRNKKNICYFKKYKNRKNNNNKKKRKKKRKDKKKKQEHIYLLCTRSFYLPKKSKNLIRLEVKVKMTYDE